MQIKVTDKAPSREWTITLTEMEVAKIYGQLMKELYETSPPLKEALIIAAVFNKGEELFDKISKARGGGIYELLRQIHVEHVRLGHSQMPEDKKVLDEFLHGGGKQAFLKKFLKGTAFEGTGDLI